jgi:hypothetical protein
MASFIYFLLSKFEHNCLPNPTAIKFINKSLLLFILPGLFRLLKLGRFPGSILKSNRAIKVSIQKARIYIKKERAAKTSVRSLN